MLVIKHETNPNLKAKLQEKVIGYMDRAEKIKDHIATKARSYGEDIN